MYKCPLIHGNAKTFEEQVERWVWHHKNCTCVIMELYYYKMIDQDDHVRVYWEAQGKLKVHWDIEYGMLLEYPKDIHDMVEIRYPYR